MSDRGERGLRVALVDGGEDVAAGLRAAGHRPLLVAAGVVPPVEELLARRGFTASLTAVPLLAAALLRARPDVVEAFSPTAAVGALAARQLTGRPVVFTCSDVLERAHLADRRLRLRTLAAAVERSDALLASSDASRTALRRWMAVDAPLAAPGDVDVRVRVYGEVIRQA